MDAADAGEGHPTAPDFRVPEAVDAGGRYLYPFQVRRPRDDVPGHDKPENYIRPGQQGIQFLFSRVIAAEFGYRQCGAVFNVYFGADRANAAQSFFVGVGHRPIESGRDDEYIE
jgi:hypothetical protein